MAHSSTLLLPSFTTGLFFPSTDVILVCPILELLFWRLVLSSCKCLCYGPLRPEPAVVFTFLFLLMFHCLSLYLWCYVTISAAHLHGLKGSTFRLFVSCNGLVGYSIAYVTQGSEARCVALSALLCTTNKQDGKIRNGCLVFSLQTHLKKKNQLRHLQTSPEGSEKEDWPRFYHLGPSCGYTLIMSWSKGQTGESHFSRPLCDGLNSLSEMWEHCSSITPLSTGTAQTLDNQRT